MATDLATRIPAQLPEGVEQALVNGDLAELKPADRVKLYLGVWIHNPKLERPYRACLRVNGKIFHLGYYATLAEAETVVVDGRARLMSHSPEARSGETVGWH